MTTEVVRIQLRRGTASQWTSNNPTLALSEFGVETDTGKFKIGNGETAWTGLSYFMPGDFANYATPEDIDSALEDYLTISSATSLYLSQSNASSTYLTQNNAASTYAPKSGVTFTGDVVLNADPTVSLGAATKQYVDNIASGIIAKPSVIAASTTNISGTYDNGTLGVGATLTIPATATLTIDGIDSWEQYDGILLKDQTNAAENGRWVMLTIGDAETDWVLRRCGLCDTADEIPGMYIFVTGGTVNAGTGWVAVVDDPATFTVGTDDINMYNFTSSVSYTNGNGILFNNGTEIAIDTNVVRTFSNTDISNFATREGTETLTNKTFGSISTETNIVAPTLFGVKEKLVLTGTALGATNNVDVFTSTGGNIIYFNTQTTASTAASITIRYNGGSFTDTNFPIGTSISVTVLVNNTSTFARYINTVNASGLTISPAIRWINATAPTSGNVGSIDVYNIALLKTASNTAVCLASLTKF